MKTLEEMLPEIRLKVSQADLWGQLAEECAELTQAALKMERLLRGTNPPALSSVECRSVVLEEVADVQLMLAVLNYADTGLTRCNMAYKAMRWLKRIESSKLDGLNSSGVFIDDPVTRAIKNGEGLCPIVREEDDLK